MKHLQIGRLGIAWYPGYRSVGIHFGPCCRFWLGLGPLDIMVAR